MRQRVWLPVLVMACLPLLRVRAQTAASLSPAVREYISVDNPIVALMHVRVMDGTGAPLLEDQTVVLAEGKIKSVENASTAQVPAGARVLDLSGHTVIPGLLGMHDHLFYPAGNGRYNTLTYSFPRLYLASGVTTIRTTGSMEPYTDLNLKKLIDAGEVPGPKMHVTGPYLEGKGTPFFQMHELTGPDDARRMVEYWADQGVTSFKAYTHITEAELAAATEALHKRGLKITGHLCSVGFRRAAELGIDNLEHGLMADSEFVPGKQKDVCPERQRVLESLAKLDVNGSEVQETIQVLVKHKVAVTSTLAVSEPNVPGRPQIQQRALDAMAPNARAGYLERRLQTEAAPNPVMKAVFKKAMEFEYAFAKAGGLLLAGVDPTGGGGALAGFGDQRQVELLVEAGFTPVEAIKIATANGAAHLGVLDHVGTVTVGKAADLVVIQGNPSARISEIENVKIVFKDGIGYDPSRLIDSVRGHVGMN